MAVSYPSIRVAPIVISCLLLIVFGVVMIGSASVVEGRRFLNLHLVLFVLQLAPELLNQ